VLRHPQEIAAKSEQPENEWIDDPSLDSASPEEFKRMRITDDQSEKKKTLTRIKSETPPKSQQRNENGRETTRAERRTVIPPIKKVRRAKSPCHGVTFPGKTPTPNAPNPKTANAIGNLRRSIAP